VNIDPKPPRVPNMPGDKPEETPNNPIGPLPENRHPVDEPADERERRDDIEDHQENLI
jgi:hypothetical protein